MVADPTERGEIVDGMESPPPVPVTVREAIFHPVQLSKLTVSLSGTIAMIDEALQRIDINSDGAKLIVDASHPSIQFKDFTLGMPVRCVGQVKKKSRRMYFLASSISASWLKFIDENTLSKSSVPYDFGLALIAAHCNQVLAHQTWLDGAENEANGNLPLATSLYKKSYRLWPALDSVVIGGLPSGVREDAISANYDFSSKTTIDVIDVNLSRQSPVVFRSGVLTHDDIKDIENLRTTLNSSSNPQNATHKNKNCTFLNDPPSHPLKTHVPAVLGKLLKFASDAWLEGAWGNSENGPLSGLNQADGIKSLSCRVAEFWHYDVGGNLEDNYHNDTDSVITIVCLLSDEKDFEGGNFRTYECGDVNQTHKMKKGDSVCFVSHKYHNVQTVTSGIRKSLVIELWQGANLEGR
ncbi:hypothetical protein ScalyP_jg9195 [Parmales sp. scaly parma]|nr:hypothetical protein ScalyP_jg9195 [Parmales sp. scaly parma]